VRHSETTSEQPASGASSERKNARVAAVGGKNHVSCDFAYEPASISAAEKAFQSRDELVANWPRGRRRFPQRVAVAGVIAPALSTTQPAACCVQIVVNQRPLPLRSYESRKI